MFLRHDRSNLPRHLVLVLLCIYAVFPIFWMILTSLKPLAEVLNSSLFIHNPTLLNYADALSRIPILRMSFNTFIIAVSQTITQLIAAITASYALTRWEFKGRRLVVGILSLTWIIPFQAIMIPNYITVSSLQLRNTLTGVVMPYMASVFATLSLYSAFRSFPKALIEAALIDGASEISILLRILVPNLLASISSLAILLFINGWNEYVWAMIVSSNLQQAPIQVGLQSFLSGEGSDWGPMMAAATMSSLPILVIYLLLQEQITNSFVRWGIK